MIRATQPYLNFNGDAADAIELYTSALGAEVVSIMRWGDMPNADFPPEVAKRVMHVELKIGEGVVMASDVPPDQKVEVGSTTSVMLQFTEPGEIDGKFDALAKGGQVLMPVENTFWNARYGMLVDRFGIRWQFHCPLDG